TTELVGPAFATQAAALEAFGRGAALPAWCALRPVAPPGPRLRPVAPVLRDGVRWPTPDPAAPAALWRLAVTWWRSGPAPEGEPLGAARTLRRKGEGAGLDGEALRRLADQPLRPARAQRALDIGLFEARRPEAPELIMPDE
ncbi:MAG: hypothetical protein INR64_15740, partial [Caulobacteraceae bacterium]|nr:hypothetical protein [Caulobacter sp.]